MLWRPEKNNGGKCRGTWRNQLWSKRKKRKHNFSVYENDVITENDKNHHETIQSKLTNNTTNKKKHEIWEEITRAVNAYLLYVRYAKQWEKRPIHHLSVVSTSSWSWISANAMINRKDLTGVIHIHIFDYPDHSAQSPRVRTVIKNSSDICTGQINMLVPNHVKQSKWNNCTINFVCDKN